MYTYHKGYKVRLYPTKDQEEMFWKHIHTCRFIWNEMLEQCNIYYEVTRKRLNYKQMSKIITAMRSLEETEWLSGVCRHSLNRVCKQLDDAFDRFFNRTSKFPKFKSKKRYKKSYPVRCDKNLHFVSEDRIRIPKCGVVKCKFDYRKENIDLFNITLNRPVITYTNNGKWILSFSLEYENQVLPNENYSLGIDMGILEAATYSYKDLEGKVHTEVVENLNKSEKIKDLDRKLLYVQKQHSRIIRTAQRLNLDFRSSKRYQKCLKKLRKLYYHRMNIIRDYYHKITSHIVYDIIPSYIIMEGLNIKGLLKNHRLSKKIAYSYWFEFQSMLQYKADRICIPTHKVDRFYPSSQICSNCGCMKKLHLDERIYLCHECGLVIDRDINASINLMNYK